MKQLQPGLLATTHAVHILHETSNVCKCKDNLQHCTWSWIQQRKDMKQSKLWPGAPSGKGRSAKSGKEKGNYCREKNITMERESEEGSLNCNKPRARQNSLTHTHPVYTSLLRIKPCSRKTKHSKRSLWHLQLCRLKTPRILPREPPHHKVHLVAVLEHSVVSHDLQGHDGSVPSCRLIGDVQISIFSAPSEETPSANEGHVVEL